MTTETRKALTAAPTLSGHHRGCLNDFEAAVGAAEDLMAWVENLIDRFDAAAHDEDLSDEIEDARGQWENIHDLLATAQQAIEEAADAMSDATTSGA